MLAKSLKKPKALKKKLTMFRPQIRSRHPSHKILRTELPLLPFRSVVRLGSTTVLNDTVENGGNRIEINKVQAIKNSASKLLMKQCFNRDGVKTAKWCKASEKYEILDKGIRFLLGQNDHEEFNGLEFPIVAKSLYGSRGQGNTLILNKESLDKWLVGKTLSNYIFEKFYSYSREYRLHITKEGCFYTCRKMLKQDTPENDRWRRHDDNSVWILESNPDFDKPVNWSSIVEHSVKALNAVGLDIGAVDVKVQSKLDNKGNIRENPDFIIIEINSAPSFGELTAEKYIIEINKLLIMKKRNG